MEQLDLFEIIEKIEKQTLEENSIKKVKVEVTKTYDNKVVLEYRLSGAEEEIKQKLTQYFESVKNKLGIKEYKFLRFEIIN